jgi:hypothetical protein
MTTADGELMRRIGKTQFDLSTLRIKNSSASAVECRAVRAVK